MTHNHIQQLDPSPDQQHLQHCKTPSWPARGHPSAFCRPAPSCTWAQNLALASLSPWCHPPAPRPTPWQHPPSAPSSVVLLSLLSGAGKHRATRSASGCQHERWALDHCSKTIAPSSHSLASPHIVWSTWNSNIFMADSKLCDTTYDYVFNIS